jgi:hypothetical protein
MFLGPQSQKAECQKLSIVKKGTQYTSPSWSNFLEGNRIKISMDGKGRATDKI